MVVLLIVQFLLNVFKSIFILKTGQQLEAKLILGYYKHLLSLPQRFFDTMRVGEIINRVNDAVKIRIFINEVGIETLMNCLVLVFSLALMFSYYWKLAVIVLLVIPFYGLAYWIANKLNCKVERKVMDSSVELESQLVESVHNIQTIKSFGIADFTNLKIELRFVSLLTNIYKSSMNSIFSANAGLLISRASTIAVLWIGTGFVLEQQITTGELMFFYAIIGYFTNPVNSLLKANKSYQNARIAAGRLLEIMNLENTDEEDKLDIRRDELGDIKFEEVTFRYGTRKEVLEDFSITIKKGEITAIVGESGSGKSTIASILSGLYSINQGVVMIGNYNLSQIKQNTLNRHFGIVPQQINFFTGTVLENIALGAFEPNTAKITQLAQKTGSLKFIQEFPEGINSRLGEHGHNLSSGQRQRLAIMRALYHNPQIIIFDEATSALDSKSEQHIIDIMTKLKVQGKTIIAISHRAHVVQIADRTILLDNGQVKADGNHYNLLDQNDQYRDFWK